MNTLFKIFGYWAAFLSADSAGLDRLLWLKKHFRKGLNTLDAGCGSGGFAFYAAKNGLDATGITNNPEEAHKASERAAILGLKNIKFLTYDLRRLAELRDELGQFDQIICFETIEHIRDDVKLIQNLSALLKTGGLLYLTTPYKNYHRLWGDEIDMEESGGHVRWGYTHEEMAEIFRKANLRTDVQEYITGFFVQKLASLQRLLANYIPGFLVWFLTFPLRLLQILDYVIPIKYPALSIAVVGRKI